MLKSDGLIGAAKNFNDTSSASKRLFTTAASSCSNLHHRKHNRHSTTLAVNDTSFAMLSPTHNCLYILEDFLRRTVLMEANTKSQVAGRTEARRGKCAADES